MAIRVVLGAQSDGTYGLRCSQPHHNARANPVDQLTLTFNSDWSNLIQTGFSGTQLNIAHGASATINFPSLGYVPFAYTIYRQVGTSWWGGVNGNTTVYQDHLVINNLSTTFSIDAAFIILKMHAET